MKKIVYQRQDGGITVVTPVISRNDPEDFTEDDALKRALSKDVPPDATNVRVVEESEVPRDRYFRNAWKSDLSVDMPKAREIHRQKMREARAPKLAALDIDQLRGKNVEAEKQALRDVTDDPRIDAAKTPEELKAVWPGILN